MPNEYGGRENLEAIEFLRNTNRVLGEQTPGAVTMAEVHRLRRGYTTVFDGRSWLLVQMEPRLDA